MKNLTGEKWRSGGPAEINQRHTMQKIANTFTSLVVSVVFIILTISLYSPSEKRSMYTMSYTITGIVLFLVLESKKILTVDRKTSRVKYK